jgi:AcrR family transcriptional regulator
MTKARHTRDRDRAALRARRREELLDAALVVVRRDGPHASMEAIATEAGITKPILYRHFDDRDGLVRALADRFADDLVERLEKALPRSPDIRAGIATTIDSYIGFIEEDPGLYRFLTQHVPAGGETLMVVVDRVASLIASYIGEALHLFGVDSGAALPWANGIVGMVHLAGDRWVARPTMPRHRLVEYLTSLLYDGMAGSVIRKIPSGAERRALAAQLGADLTGESVWSLETTDAVPAGDPALRARGNGAN